MEANTKGTPNLLHLPVTMVTCLKYYLQLQLEVLSPSLEQEVAGPQSTAVQREAIVMKELKEGGVEKRGM